MAYVDSASFAWWRSLARDGKRVYAPSPFFQFQASLIGALESSGTRFLVGTDAANPLMVAGFSVHDEIAALVHAGSLSAYDVLLAATRRPAEFLDDSTGGRIALGARGDLLLDDATPLNDFTTHRRRGGVLVGGRWLDRAVLDSMLASVPKRK